MTPVASSGTVQNSAALAQTGITESRDIGNAAPDTRWYSEDKTVFHLTDGSELAGLAVLTEKGNDFSGRTICLDQDLDLSAFENWTPIGSRSFPFAGTFDGGGRSVAGLRIQGSRDDVGLFGLSVGTIRNFTLQGEVTGGNQTAGVAAVAGGTITGVTSQVNVFAAGSQAGGLTAEMLDGLVIENCHNEGTIRNNTVEKSSGKLGGIAGRLESGSAWIRNCSNSGTVNGYQYVSGILGASFGNVEITACCNTGDITGRSFGKVYLGGIVGKLENGTIDSCYNTGTLTDTHETGTRHIRAVGGIAGCEEGHATGTAISNCYNAGMILLNTENMDASGFIYMSGNISGGNQSTDENTMTYSNCYYLANTFPATDPSHPSYVKWCDVFKANPLAYDTEAVTRCSAGQLASADLGRQFTTGAPYPVLFWQAGQTEPGSESPEISWEVVGGHAVVDAPESASAGDIVRFRVQDMESGKQIRLVRVTDVSGAVLEVRRDDDMEYSFLMPSRPVQIAVDLENVTADDAAWYPLLLPAEPDAIWSVHAESGYYDPQSGTAAAGALVTIIVEKQPGAVTTSFDGIRVTGTEGELRDVQESHILSSGGARYYGEYRFTMPDCSVKVDLLPVYRDLKVSDSDGKEKIYTRESVLRLGAENERTFFSGWSTETEPFLGVSDRYVTLAQLLGDAGIGFRAGDTLRVTAADGFSQNYSYEELFAGSRCCYSDILEHGADSFSGSPSEPVLTVTANMTSEGAPEELVCDTLFTYRFFFGQTEEELRNRIKVVDHLPKCVTEIFVEHTSGEESGEPEFRTHSLLLSGKIGVNFYMDLPGTVSRYEGSYMDFMVNGRRQRVFFDEKKRNPDRTYYGFTCSVDSVSMADEITAVFYMNGENSETWKETYSVAQYVESFMEVEDSFDQQTISLIHALADYGHHIQPFLAYTRGWTIGGDHLEMAGFTDHYDMDTIREAVEPYAVIRETRGSDIRKITYSLLLDSETSVYIYLEPEKGYCGEMTVRTDGASAKAVRLPDGRYRVAIPDISAHRLGETHGIEITTDHGTAFVAVSALSYVSGVLHSAVYGDDLYAQNAVAALYKYYEAAEAYIDSI